MSKNCNSLRLKTYFFAFGHFNFYTRRERFSIKTALMPSILLTYKRNMVSSLEMKDKLNLQLKDNMVRTHNGKLFVSKHYSPWYDFNFFVVAKLPD